MGRTCHSKPYEVDTGSMLWSSYNDSLSSWVPLDRVNALNLDPLFYGVYGRDGVAFAYHEGAGTTQRSKSKVQPVTGDSYDDAFRELRLAVAAAREDDQLHEPMDRLVANPNPNPNPNPNLALALALALTLSLTLTRTLALTLP